MVADAYCIDAERRYVLDDPWGHETRVEPHRAVMGEEWQARSTGLAEAAHRHRKPKNSRTAVNAEHAIARDHLTGDTFEIGMPNGATRNTLAFWATVSAISLAVFVASLVRDGWSLGFLIVTIFCLVMLAGEWVKFRSAQ